jgi:hypothetical protein
VCGKVEEPPPPTEWMEKQHVVLEVGGMHGEVVDLMYSKNELTLIIDLKFNTYYGKSRIHAARCEN